MRAHDPSRARLRGLGRCVGSTDGRADRGSPDRPRGSHRTRALTEADRGYSMPDQVEAICRSLDRLAVASVVAVGHSEAATSSLR